MGFWSAWGPGTRSPSPPTQLPPGEGWKNSFQDGQSPPGGRGQVEDERTQASLTRGRMWSLHIKGCGKGAACESTPRPCPQPLAPQMVVQTLNLNEKLRPVEVGVSDLINTALNLLFFPKPVIPLLSSV